jgi:aminocarboxymuconate-semialdehyde decarboxylase
MHSPPRMRVDIHNHVIPERALDVLHSDPVYRVAIVDGRWRGGNHPAFELDPSFRHAEAKLDQLERNSIDGAVLSAAPPLFCYETGATAGERICRAANEGMRSFAAAAPGRLWWLAHVPLQAPDRAVTVLADAAEAGCVGVQVGSSVNGTRLDDPRLAPFWAAADNLGLPVVIHPDPSYSIHDGLEAFYLRNVIGMPLETTIAVKRLISAGVLPAHPRVQVVLLHGGGYFPYQAGRLRHARTVRGELSELGADPWEALGQLWFDVITHDAQALRYLVNRVGEERVVLGTDLPFDMALPEPVDAVERAVGSDTLNWISERNPARLFGLDTGATRGSNEELQASQGRGRGVLG